MTNVNKAIPIVEFMIGGKKRNLVFTLGVLAKAEQYTGKNTLSADNNIWANMNVTDLLYVTLAALQREEPNLTFDELGNMLGVHDIKDLMEAVGEAFKLSVPEEEKKV